MKNQIQAAEDAVRAEMRDYPAVGQGVARTT